MKTIEEKARAYDKAVINGSRLWESGVITRENYEYIFPELKESEDERIRKVLRERIIRYDPNNEILIKEEGISQRQFLAWLEKQGEQKPTDKVEPKFKVGQTIIYKGNKNIAPTKITISDIVKGQYWDRFSCCILPISDQDNWELVEQKPAEWSEEDLVRIENCISLIGKTGDGEVKWLKDLKDRVQPQQKQEWSEEDDIWLNNLICHFETGLSIEHERVASWLKSLKDRYAWKPSDEQLYWIKWVAGRLPDTEKANEAEAVLEELLEELKKLKKEVKHKIMKTNEAPEKLYVDTAENFNDVWVRAFRPPFKNCGVEYTRTDAFIEKATKYVANHFLAPGMDNEIKDFVNYMKGE